jgi:hypothetical protein
VRGGLDHADDWDTQVLAQGVECVRGRGVARDDDALHVAPNEERADLEAESSDGFLRLVAVRQPRGVAEVFDRLARQQAEDLAHGRESADAGVEHPNRSRVVCGGHRIS